MDSHRNDILLVEQIDRLTRLSNSDWITLKKQIEQHELRIVAWMYPGGTAEFGKNRTLS
ncbi:TPA: hypothetical protein IFC90_004795 [Escherichia coli]|nr:hypothetical protein [Escherichia coli]